MGSSKKYVADSRYFRGDVLTVMSDGVHCDGSGHTLMELREKERNPYLCAFGVKELRKKGRIYMESLCTLFREISPERYEELSFYSNIRKNRDSFFEAEPYYWELHDFYFKVSGRCFTGIRPVNLPYEELQRQIGEHYRHVTCRPEIRKWNIAVSGTDGNGGRMGTAYFFVTDKGCQRFICNLTVSGEAESVQEARKDVARILRSLRRHHFTYYAGTEGIDDLDRFMDYMEKNDYTLLSAGTFFQYPINRESVTFTGKIKETGKRFLYRIYDREIFLHLLKRLRGIKRETEHTERIMT